MTIKNNFRHTLNASYIGYITQAIVNNYAPLLFVFFRSRYGISILQISLLIVINFGTQLLIDIVSVFLIDKTGYKAGAVTAHFSAAAGMIVYCILPSVMDDKFVALLIPTLFNALGGGLCEVVVSPIVEACPTENKAANMSILHSFYCWGQLGVILISTLFFGLFGLDNWKYLSIIYAMLPLFNAFYFINVPVNHPLRGKEGIGIKKLFKIKAVYLLFLMMICAGASELAMSQWASTFAEEGLKFNKSVSDLIGPAMFAALMGISRVIHAKLSDKIKLETYLIISSLICVLCYLTASLSDSPVISIIACAMTGFSVGVMWPGVYSFSAASIKNSGGALFALLAFSGDLGCISGPALVGVISDRFSGDLKIGFLISSVFPLLLLISTLILNKKTVDPQYE